MRDYLRNASLALVMVLFVVPQAPIQIRYLLVALALCAIILTSEFVHRVLKWQIIFTVYAIAVGAFVTYANNDGSLALVLAPLRSVIIAMLAVVAWRRRSPRFFLLFISGWILIQLCGLIYEHTYGSLWLRLPFPIVANRDLSVLYESLDAREAMGRYGAFTYESSVVGGMAGLFAVVALLALATPQGAQSRHSMLFNKALAWFSVLGAIAINVLAKTKSGGFVIGSFVVIYVMGEFLSGSAWRFQKAAKVVGLAVAVACAGFVVYYTMRSEELNTYIQEETERVIKLGTDFELEDSEGGGLATRFAYLQLSVFGLPYHPLGVGSSGGYTYVKPVLEWFEIPHEISTVFAADQYMMTSPFCSMLMYAGVLGVFFWWRMFRAAKVVMEPFNDNRTRSWTVAGLGAFIIYTICVGISPYLALLIFLTEASRSFSIASNPDLVPATGINPRSWLARHRKRK